MPDRTFRALRTAPSGVASPTRVVALSPAMVNRNPGSTARPLADPKSVPELDFRSQREPQIWPRLKWQHKTTAATCSLSIVPSSPVIWKMPIHSFGTCAEQLKIAAKRRQNKSLRALHQPRLRLERTAPRLHAPEARQSNCIREHGAGNASAPFRCQTIWPSRQGPHKDSSSSLTKPATRTPQNGWKPKAFNVAAGLVCWAGHWPQGACHHERCRSIGLQEARIYPVHPTLPFCGIVVAHHLAVKLRPTAFSGVSLTRWRRSASTRSSSDSAPEPARRQPAPATRPCLGSAPL